jgi:hypothetical protein
MASFVCLIAVLINACEQTFLNAMPWGILSVNKCMCVCIQLFDLSVLLRTFFQILEEYIAYKTSEILLLNDHAHHCCRKSLLPYIHTCMYTHTCMHSQYCCIEAILLPGRQVHHFRHPLLRSMCLPAQHLSGMCSAKLGQQFQTKWPVSVHDN